MAGLKELTPRERAVAEAARSGASTRSIADELFVSVRTVESHLGAIYRKLGLEGRTQLVAFMLQQDLAEPRAGETGPSPETSAVPGDDRVPVDTRTGALRWPAILTLAHPFVGRAAEQRILSEVLPRDAATAASTVLVGGEPGIGKSALVAQAASKAMAAGFQVLAGRCDRVFRAPFRPVGEALRPVLQGAGTQLASLVGPTGGSLAAIVPDLADQLPDRLSADEPSVARGLVADAVVSCLAAVTSKGPVLLILEDLQWSDVATLELARQLMGNPRLPALLLVGTFRNTELSRQHPLPGFLADLWRDSSVRRIDLEGLPAGDTAVLAQDLALTPVDSAAVEALQSRTGGNPFFLLQLLSFPGGSSSFRELPRSVREVVLDRAAQLGDEVLAVLQAAAVLGGDFDVALLVALLGRLERPLGAGSAKVSLAQAVAAGLVRSRAESDDAFGFVHDLVRDALLSELGALSKARLHQAAGEALVTVQGDGPEGNLVAIADQFAAAAPLGEGERAAQYALAAAHQALDRLAPRDAANLAAQGLAHVPHGDDQLTFDLLVATADAQATLMDVAAHRRATLAAVEVARRLDDPMAIVRAVDRNTVLPVMGELDLELLAAKEEAIAALGDEPSPQRVRLLTSASYQRTIGGHGWAAADQASQAVSDGRQLGDQDAIVGGLYALAAASLGRPDLAEQLAVSDELVEAGQERVDRVPERDGRRFRGLLRLCGGNRAGFSADLDYLSDFGARSRSVFVESLVGEWRTMEAMLDGDLQRAEDLANSVLATSGDDPNFLLGWFVELAWIRTEQDRAGEILPLAEATAAEHPDLVPLAALTASLHAEIGNLDEARRIAEPIAANDCGSVPRDWLRPATLAYLAAAACLALDAPAQQAVAAQLEPYAGQLLVVGQGALVAGVADHLRAALLTASGTVRDSDLGLFGEAYTTAMRAGAGLLGANTQIDWAAAHLRRATEVDVARAHELLAAALAVGEQLGIARLVRKARQLASSAAELPGG